MQQQAELLQEIYQTPKLAAPVQRFATTAQQASCKAGCNGSCSGLNKEQDYPKAFYA